MPPARHILTYAQGLGPGGVERAQLALAAQWVAAGRRVTLVLGEARGVFADTLPAGVEVIALGSPRLRALAALPGVVRRLRPDVIFCPGDHYSSIAAWTRIRLGDACPPIVAKLSNTVVRDEAGLALRFGQRAWLRHYPRFVDRLVAMTPATAGAALTATGLPADRIAVIPNPPLASPPGAAPPGLPAGRFLLGVGRLVPQKRWDRAIAALPRLRDATVPLVLLGDGAARASLLAQAGALGVADRVHLPGHHADPLAWMRAATALVLVSDFEGVPGVLREALSVGTPVIASAASPAIGEIVTDAALGTVVPRGDEAALVAALDHWLTPGRARPAPVTPPGADAAARYLALFDRVVTARSRPT